MRILSYALALALLSAAGTTASYAADAKVSCKLTFTMKGWSAFYKTASGSGTIKCNNGQSKTVKLTAKGGGLTVGKSTIEDGHGEFSGTKECNGATCAGCENDPRRAAVFDADQFRLDRAAPSVFDIRNGV